MAVITSRDIEVLNSQSENIARRSSVAKRCSDPNIPIHPGMTHVKDGVVNAGFSATQVATALAGGKSPTDPPTIGKVLTLVTSKPGMHSRIDPLDDDAYRELGARVLEEGRLAIRGKR